MDDLDPEVFATYTGPDGGLTSISKLEDKLNLSMQEADDSEDFDFIDVEDVVGSRPRRPSSTDEPSPLVEGGIVNLDLPSSNTSSTTGPKYVIFKNNMYKNVYISKENVMGTESTY